MTIHLTDWFKQTDLCRNATNVCCSEMAGCCGFVWRNKSTL